MPALRRTESGSGFEMAPVPPLRRGEATTHGFSHVVPSHMVARQPSSYPDPAKEHLQPYLILDTVAGGPPFHHDVLAHIISFVSGDLQTLIAISAVRRSWRFFANYHHGWRRFEVASWQRYLTHDAFADLKSDRVIINKLIGGREKPVPYVRDDLHERVGGKVTEIGKKRPNKAYYLLGSTGIPLSFPMFFLSFILFAILGCFPLSVAANRDSDTDDTSGRLIFKRQDEDKTSGWSDGQVLLVGYGREKRNFIIPSHLSLRLCDGYVQQTTSCSSCKCKSSSSSSSGSSSSWGSSSSSSWGRSGRSTRTGRFGRSSRGKRQERNFTVHSEGDDSLVMYYPSRRSSGSCTCCSSTTWWSKCDNTTQDALASCSELMDAARNTVQWNLTHGIFSLLVPPLFLLALWATSSCGFLNSSSELVPLQDQKAVKYRALSLFVGFPLQLCLLATAAFSLHYADSLGKTPCSAWERLMQNNGGGDRIKASGNGWSTADGLRMITVPLVLSLIIGAVTLWIYVFWFGLIIYSKPRRKTEVIEVEL